MTDEVEIDDLVSLRNYLYPREKLKVICENTIFTVGTETLNGIRFKISILVDNRDRK